MAKNSIVDYLNSSGKASDFGSRSKLASQYGIGNYVGSASQNLDLLSYLQGTKKKTPAPILALGTNPIAAPAYPTETLQTPSVISSDKGQEIADKAKTDLKKASDSLAQKSQSQAQAKAQAEANAGGLPPEVQSELGSSFDTSAEKDLIALNADKIAFSDSEANKANIQSLQDQRQTAIDDATKADAEAVSALQGVGMNEGYSRYSGNSFKAIVTSALEAGKKKIQKLDTEYKQKLDDAQRLFDRGQLVEANTKLRELVKIKEDAAEEVKKQQEELDKLDKEQTKRTDEINRDLIIANLVKEGTTDPVEVFKTLQENGFEGTAKEVTDSLKALSDGGAGDLGVDANMLNYAKKQGWLPQDANIFDFWRMKRDSTNQPQKTTDGLPNNIVAQVDKLSSSFDSAPIVKQFNEVLNKKLGAEAIIKTDIKGPADLALVFDFMKALDPTSVVRESEYQTAAKAGNIFQGAFAKYNGYLKEGGGFLPENVRQEFISIMNKKYEAIASQYDNLKSETSRKINKKTGADDGADYLTDYKGALDLVQSLGGDETSAENTVVEKSKNNPALKAKVAGWLKFDPDIGRPLTFAEILQVYPELFK